MRVLLASIFVLSVFFLCPYPAKAQNAPMSHGQHMNLDQQKKEYTDKAFLSGMLAHHEGAVSMAEEALKTPPTDLDPNVFKWAQAVISLQTKEIHQMREMLKDMGGVDQIAYGEMEKEMHQMMHGETDAPKDANVFFVSQMLPHHAQAVEMSVPALLFSTNKSVLDLAKNIIADQAAEMYEFRTWLLNNSN